MDDTVNDEVRPSFNLSQQLVADALAAIPPAFADIREEDLLRLADAVRDVLGDNSERGGLAARHLLGAFLRDQLATVVHSRKALKAAGAS